MVPGAAEEAAVAEAAAEVVVAAEVVAADEEVAADDVNVYSSGISEVLISLRHTYFPSFFTNRLI